MENHHRSFVPAAGHDFALPLYDPLTRLMGADRVRRNLIAQASLRSGLRVLDVGCGTGSLVLMAKQMQPGIETTGLDPDEKALERAARKARRAALSVRFVQGFAGTLPSPDSSFDRVFSSLMFHHLSAEEKLPMLREVRRVLAPGGSLHLVDFVAPEGGAHGRLQRLFRLGTHEKVHIASDISTLLREAGFHDVHEMAHATMLLQPIIYYRAGVATA